MPPPESNEAQTPSTHDSYEAIRMELENSAIPSEGVDDEFLNWMKKQEEYKNEYQDMMDIVNDKAPEKDIAEYESILDEALVSYEAQKAPAEDTGAAAPAETAPSKPSARVNKAVFDSEEASQTEELAKTMADARTLIEGLKDRDLAAAYVDDLDALAEQYTQSIEENDVALSLEIANQIDALHLEVKDLRREQDRKKNAREEDTEAATARKEAPKSGPPTKAEKAAEEAEDLEALSQRVLMARTDLSEFKDQDLAESYTEDLNALTSAYAQAEAENDVVTRDEIANQIDLLCLEIKDIWREENGGVELTEEDFEGVAEAHRAAAQAQIEAVKAKDPVKAAALKEKYDSAVNAKDSSGVRSTYQEIDDAAKGMGIPSIPAPETPEPRARAERARSSASARPSSTPAPVTRSEKEFVAELKIDMGKYVTQKVEGDKTIVDLTVPDKGSRIHQIVGPEGSDAVIKIPADKLATTVLTDPKGVDFRWNGSTWADAGGKRMLIGPSYTTHFEISQKAPAASTASAPDASARVVAGAAPEVAHGPYFRETTEMGAPNGYVVENGPIDPAKIAPDDPTLGINALKKYPSSFTRNDVTYKAVYGPDAKTPLSYQNPAGETLVLQKGDIFRIAYEAAPVASAEKKEEEKKAPTELEKDMRKLVEELFMDHREDQLNPKIDAQLKGKTYTNLHFADNEGNKQIVYLTLTDAGGKTYTYSGESDYNVGTGPGKRILHPFDRTKDTVQLNGWNRQALKDLLVNVSEGKTL